MKKTLFTMCLAAALSACGGGGDSDADQLPPNWGSMNSIQRTMWHAENFCAPHGKLMATNPVNPPGAPTYPLSLEIYCVDQTRTVMTFNEAGDRIN